MADSVEDGSGSRVSKPSFGVRAETDKPKQKTSYFPLGYREGFNQWWQSITPAAAEHKVMSFLPYMQQAPTQMQTSSTPTPTQGGDASAQDDISSTTHSTQVTKESDPYGPRSWTSSLIKLSGKDRALNEFSVERLGEDVENNLVMIHGYGAGLGFFYKNFEPLSRVPNWRLYALDLLGMGRSSRPPFNIRAKDRAGKIAEAEAWFVDSLEEWRKERKIERFTLLGHSLGGYMAVCYALKYPGRLNKLILASPVGIPEDPYAVNADLPEPDSEAVNAEFSADQAETTSKNAKPAPDPQRDWRRRGIFPKIITYLWDANVSPFSLVRLSGPLGPRLVSGWSSRRFSQLPPAESQALHDYAYSLFRQRGSGEYALSYILAPGAFARSPLIRRIGSVGHQQIPSPSGGSPVRERGLPIVLMYGENDWMDIAGGYAAEEKLKEMRRRLSKEDREQDVGSEKVLVVQKAGHHLYLDGYDEFNGMITQEMLDVERRERKRKRLEDSKNQS